MKVSGNCSDLISFQANRAILQSAKSLLRILEDLKDDDVISQEYFEKQRKRVLDTSNDNLRELKDFISNFKIDFK